MQVTTKLSRSDIFKFNLLLFWRLKSSLIFVAVVATMTIVFSLVESRPDSAKQVALTVAIGLVFGVLALVSTFIICLPLVLLASNQQSGVLGEHIYTLTEDGFHERTPVNESLHKWIGIKDVKNIGDYLVLQINSYLFHIVPRRSFATNEGFEAFFHAAQVYWKAAKKP